MNEYRDAMKRHRDDMNAMKIVLAEHNLSLADSVSVNESGGIKLHYPESALGPTVMRAGDLGPLEEGLGAVIDISAADSDEPVPVTISRVNKDSPGVVRIHTVELEYPISLSPDDEVRFLRGDT